MYSPLVRRQILTETAEVAIVLGNIDDRSRFELLKAWEPAHIPTWALANGLRNVESIVPVSKPVRAPHDIRESIDLKDKHVALEAIVWREDMGKIKSTSQAPAPALDAASVVPPSAGGIRRRSGAWPL